MVAQACKPPEAPCPTGDVCMSVEQAVSLRQTPESQLSCPKYLGWTDAGAPSAELPPAEASLDRDATHARHAKGANDVCCYHWFQSCR
jgi:hypothetical protein